MPYCRVVFETETEAWTEKGESCGLGKGPGGQENGKE